MYDVSLKTYLKNVAQLESSIYNQKKILEKGKQTFSERQPRKNQPECKTISMPPKPPELDSEAGKNRYWTYKDDKFEKVGKIGIAGFSIISFMIIMGLLFFNPGDGGADGFMIFCYVAVVPFLLMASAKLFKDTSGRQQKYDEAMRKYEQDKRWTEEQNRVSLAQWKEESETENKHFEQACRVYSKNKEDMLARLETNLNKTQKILNAYYDQGVIFSKYRNLVAVTTMYEYFASGRCTELEGPNGAYNLFEQETRQNIIITNLQDINQHLGDIKNNQYVLYQTMNQGLQTLNKLSSDISGMASCVKTIEQASQMTAYCSAVSMMNDRFQSAMLIF